MSTSHRDCKYLESGSPALRRVWYALQKGEENVARENMLYPTFRGHNLWKGSTFTAPVGTLSDRPKATSASPSLE